MIWPDFHGDLPPGWECEAIYQEPAEAVLPKRKRHVGKDPNWHCWHLSAIRRTLGVYCWEISFGPCDSYFIRHRYFKAPRPYGALRAARRALKEYIACDYSPKESPLPASPADGASSR